MGIFDNILGKIGLGKEEAPHPEPPLPKKRVVAKPPGDTTPPSHPSVVETPAEFIPPSVPAPAVDVTAMLERLAAENPQQLNWRTSIVDLLKLLEIDSSFGARKTLARELDCPEAFMHDSAKMNIWLHKTVLTRIAENGGALPKELLD